MFDVTNRLTRVKVFGEIWPTDTAPTTASVPEMSMILKINMHCARKFRFHARGGEMVSYTSPKQYIESLPDSASSEFRCKEEDDDSELMQYLSK